MVKCLKRSLFKILIDPREALEKTLSVIRGREWVDEADLVEPIAGCKVAENIITAYCNPRFPRSVVDGYAVDYRDVLFASEEKPARLRIGGRVRVYESAEGVEAGAGVAVEVDTGSMIPVGANAVVPVEYTDERNGFVEVYRSVGFGDNVAWPCSDISRGELVVRHGKPVSHRLIGVLASQGIRRLHIYRPRVCVFSTGNELVEPGKSIEDPFIYDSNRYMILSMLSTYCAKIIHHSILRDDFQEIANALTSCEDMGADIVLFSGGTSAGIEDNVYRVIRERGELIVHGLKLKPGKPTAIGVTRKGVLVIGLPGNPNSAYNVFVNVVAKILEAKNAVKNKSVETVISTILEAILALPVKAVKGRLNYNPAFLLRGVDGKVYAMPIEYESYMITRLALSDALILVPEEIHESIQKGEKVKTVVINAEWNDYSVSIAGEELPPTLYNRLPADTKTIMYGSGFAVAGIETCSIDIAVIGKNFPGLYTMNPACSYLEEYARRKHLLLKRKGFNDSQENIRVAIYPASHSLLYRVRATVKGNPVYASSYKAALYLLEKGVVDYAIVPKDIAAYSSMTKCCEAVGEVEEEYVILYRDPLMEDIVEYIVESIES